MGAQPTPEPRRFKPCPNPPKGQRCQLCGAAWLCMQTWRKPVVALRKERGRIHKQMLRADYYGSNALADANSARERGNAAKAEKDYARGQYWLDKSNVLREKIAGLDAAIAKAEGT